MNYNPYEAPQADSRRKRLPLDGLDRVMIGIALVTIIAWLWAMTVLIMDITLGI